jgi:hypothetical protein
MQLYQIATNGQKTQQLLADTNVVLRYLGVSAETLEQPEIQAQISQAIAGMAVVSQYAVEISLTCAGGGQ